MDTELFRRRARTYSPIPVLVVTMYGLWQGSNLWPLFLIFLAPVLLLYQVALAALHKWVQHRSTVPAP